MVLVRHLTQLAVGLLAIGATHGFVRFSSPLGARGSRSVASLEAEANDASDGAVDNSLSRRSAIDAGAAALALIGAQPGASLAFGEEVTTESGLKYIDISFGPPQQPRPKPGSTVKIDFEGWTGSYDGERFTKGTTEARLDSGMLIAGIDEALHTMNIGSKRRLEIKPELAYGKTGFPKAGDDAGTVVPPNTKIFFEIRLRSIKASPF